MKVQKVLSAIAMLVLLLAVATPSSAGTALGVKVSTLGLGAELTKSLTEKANLRVGGNFFTYSYSGVEDDIDYDFDLRLRSLSGLLDLHPTGGAFRISGGLLANRNLVQSASTTTGPHDIGNGTYTKSQVGTMSGRVDFKNVAPYAGIGFGNAVAGGKHIGFVMDLGIVFQGAPNVALSVTGPIASNPQFQNDLRLEQENLREDLKFFKYYPVVAVGVSFKF